MSKLISIGTTFNRIAAAAAGKAKGHPGHGHGSGRLSSALTLTRFYSAGNTEDPSGGGGEPWIPPYEQRKGEPVETIRARLLYQSRKRGMLENGILLSTFAAKYLNCMGEAELKEYDRLINLPSNDWDIYYWATGVKPIPPEFDTPILHKFVGHVRNTEREQRFTQPELN